MGLWTEAGSVPGLDVRLMSWVVEYLESWYPRKQSQHIPVHDGNSYIRITDTPALRCCQCSDTVIPEEKPDIESGLSRTCDPVLSPDHEEHPLVKQTLPTNTYKIGGRIFGDPTSDQIYHEPPVLESCKPVNIHDPLFVLLILLYNIYQHIDLTLLPPLPPSIDIIGIRSSFFPQPHWLLVIFLDNAKGCRRRRWIAACSIVWIDDAFWRTLSGTLYAFALPVLGSGRLRALLTLPNLALQYPSYEVVDASDGSQDATRTGSGLAHAGGNNNGSNTAQGTSGPGASGHDHGQRDSGHGRNGSGGGSGGGAGDNGDGDGDDNEHPKSADTPKKAFACHYFKRWPVLHMKCLNHTQIATRYVKTHLLRKHLQPIHCPTCFAIYKNNTDLTKHTVARTCQKTGTPCPYRADISKDQRDALEKRHRANDEEKWFKMWDVLFPGIKRPTSPYVTAEDLFRSFGEYVTPQFNQRLADSNRVDASQAEHVSGILAEILEGGIDTQSLLNAPIVSSTSLANQTPSSPPQQQPRSAPSEAVDNDAIGLSSLPIPAPQIGEHDTTMQQPATFGGVPLDQPSNPVFTRPSVRRHRRHTNLPSLLTTPFREPRRIRHGRMRSDNTSTLLRPTQPNMGAIQQRLYPAQDNTQNMDYLMTPSGGFGPSHTYFGPMPAAQPQHFQGMPHDYSQFHRQGPLEQTQYFDFHPNTAQYSRIGHERPLNTYPESLTNQAHGYPPSQFSYNGFNNQNAQMQPSTGILHQMYSHRHANNGQRSAQEPGTAPGQTLGGFLTQEDLQRLHMTGASAPIGESASTDSSPGEMDYQLVATQNEVSDTSQSGSPSDVLRGIIYSSEPGGG